MDKIMPDIENWVAWSLRNNLIQYLYPGQWVYFQTILGIPIGGNASPFIADVYFSLCEYCYVTKIVKTDYAMAILQSYNCRYLDYIRTVDLKYLGDIVKDIYGSTLLLEGSACSYKQDTFWILIYVLLIVNL